MAGSLESAWFFYERKRYAECIEQCQHALAADPDSTEAFYLAGLCALFLKDDELAKRMAGNLIEADPNAPEGHDLLGHLAYQEKRFDLADRHFRESLRLDPESPERYATLGVFLGHRGRVEEGITFARQGMKLDPSNTWVLEVLQVLYRLNDEPEVADEIAEQALSANPENPNVHYEVGLRLFEEGRRFDAASSMRESLRLDPADEDRLDMIAHEKVRTLRIFRRGVFPPTKPDMIVAILLVPAFWYAASLLWWPLRYVCWLSIFLIVAWYLYFGLFHVLRRLMLRRLRRGLI